MPATLITSAQRFISLSRNALNACGVEATGITPWLISRLRTSGSSNSARTASCSLATMSLGTPAGATRPSQVLPLKPGRPDSASVG
ncbi:Uncharacterised protein [Bordetella pertussis]|nr:Uncharacterised protein [Bordetella pertussis]